MKFRLTKIFFENFVKALFHRFRPKYRYSAIFKLKNIYDTHSKPPTLLYFGDSVVERISRDDKDKRSLGDIVHCLLKKHLSIAVISYSAYNTLIFYHLIAAIDRMKNRPKMVIIPLNIRSFSPQWDSHPLWQFENEIKAINDFLTGQEPNDGRIVDVPNMPDIYENYDDISVQYPFSPFNKVGQFRKIIVSPPSSDPEQIFFRKKQIFIFNYLYKLDSDHRKLLSIVNILQSLRESQISAFLYLTPINYQSGCRYVGEAFIEILKKNISLILETVQKYGDDKMIKIADWSMLFDSDKFFHPDFANEHLIDSGRQELAKKIASSVLLLADEVGILF